MNRRISALLRPPGSLRSARGQASAQAPFHGCVACARLSVNGLASKPVWPNGPAIPTSMVRLSRRTDIVRNIAWPVVSLLTLAFAALPLPARALDYLNVTVQPDRAVPGACLSFSTELPRGNSQALEPFVSLEPKADHGLQARGKDLCITGLKHGTHYALRVKAGLPAADGSTLAKDVPVDVQVPDREPQVSFEQGKTLLPWRQGVGLPLKSVNVAKAHIVVYRFAERGLVEQLSQDWFGQALSGWSIDQVADRSQKVFEGRLDIASQTNTQVATAIPLDGLVKDMQPGIYVVTAVPDGAKPDSDTDRATQWFSVSDIGLFTVKTEAGMLVSAHALGAGTPMPGVSIHLVARSNEVLGTYTTDAEGRATVPGGLLRGEHGDQPRLLTATSDRGDFTWMQLDTPAMDLSDLDVKGMSPPGARDAFLWTDRGIYRPGETVHLGALLRDDTGKPLPDLPVTLHVVRPDAVEVQTLPADLGHAGGGTLDITIPDNAYTGTWTVWASAGGDKHIGSVDVSVEDFVSPRLEAKVEMNGRAEAGAAFVPVVRADYFYGSPGADLSGQVEATIQPAKTPFDDLSDFTFGLVQEPFLPKQLEAQSFTTDDKGRAEVTFPAGDKPDSTAPLEVALHATVNDVDGRPAEADLTQPLHTADRFIGLRSTSSDLSDGAEASFEAVLVDGDGKPLGAESLQWDLVKEDYEYAYFYRDGRWQSEEVVNDTRVSGGEVTLGPDGRGRLAARVTNGRWRVEAYDASGKTASSLRFGVGWWASGASAENRKPETFTVTIDKTAPAGKVRAVVEPSFAGRVLVMLGGNGLHGVQELDMARGGGAVEFDAADVPPSGAYVVAAAISPSGAVLPRLPVRAVGLAWVPGAAAAHTLDVAIVAPEKMQPKSTLQVGIDVPGVAGEPDAYVTLAAVDEAVLRMTDFDTPDPADHYLGKREPGFELRDVYGSLIDPAGQAGRLVEGGDARAKLQMGGLDVKTFKTVALFQGPVKLDTQGKANITVEVPEFSGRLRLMAVAWTADRFGKAEQQVTVRPPLLVELTLPRFLAPGDKIRARAMLTDLEAPEQTYTVDLTSSGAVSFDRNDVLFKDVKRDKRRFADRVLTAAATPGVGRIHMAVNGPDGTRAERDFEIAVRSPNAYVTNRQLRTLEPGGHLTAGDALGEGLVPGTGTLDLAVSTVPAFDIPGLLADLRRYPYGCTEQTVSRAFPELFVSRLGEAVAIPAPDTVTGQGAVARLFSLQSEDGSFGYWSAFDTGYVWLTAYAVDYLQHAKAQGVQVPDAMQSRALGWLAGKFATVGNEPADIAGSAYAALVLARADRLDLSQLRYFASRAEGHLPSEVARVQLAAALAHVGERERATALMQGPPISRDPTLYMHDYGSTLRDSAMGLSLSIEEKLLPQRAVLAKAADLARATGGKGWLSTQEQAWLLRIAFDLHTRSALQTDINGKRNTDPERMATALPLGAGRLADVRNNGPEPIYVSLATTGIPTAPEPAEANGFTIARSTFRMDGTPVDLADVHQNEEFVAVVEGTMTSPTERRALVVDLLPAGFEPDAVSISADQGDDSKFAWLKDLTEPTFKATRDDRYVAGLTLSGDDAKFKLAYVVRAVTPGTYALPGPQVEDMYAPAFHARGAAGMLEVRPPRSPDAKPTAKTEGKPIQPVSGKKKP